MDATCVHREPGGACPGASCPGEPGARRRTDNINPGPVRTPSARGRDTPASRTDREQGESMHTSSDDSVAPLTTHLLALLGPSTVPSAAEARHLSPAMPAKPALFLDPEDRQPCCGHCLRLAGVDPAGCRPATGTCWPGEDTEAVLQ